MSKQQNIFDNDIFFNEYKNLRDRDDNLNVLLEQPAMAKLIPDLSGKSVLDLGCGYGHNCTDFVKRGAKRVVGIDISQKMLDVARSESADEKIEYVNMSMTDIEALGEKFDVIYSSLAFHYVENFAEFAESMLTLLNNGGWLLFSQEHPIITATLNGKGHFNRDENGERVSYTFSNYNQPGKREIRWFVDGVVKFHRPMGEIITSLAKAGFVIDTLCEPTPEKWAVEKLPAIAKEYLKPNFLIVKAKRT
ncbi:MAG: class I SAM-dependent methyltransferase [Clostridia bacterium]|nr:class I SAM-dependent methyltransferase [Clostridia bacterium]